MPTPTYTPLATVTLGSSASSVTFSSIPATYRDLILVFDGTATANSVVNFRYNGDSGANYYRVGMEGDGTTASSYFGTDATSLRVINWRTARSNAIHQIMDYSATDKHKTSISRGNPTDVGVQSAAGRWASTAAITSIALTLDANQFAAGCTFSLYGIAS
jgi:hypothetical protein